MEIDKKIGLAHFISILALISSIVTPLLLAPEIEESKNKPRLQIMSRTNPETESGSEYRFELLNVGSVPAKNLRIQVFSVAIDRLRKEPDLASALRKHVYMVPTFPDDKYDMSDNYIDVFLARPLGPGESLFVYLFERPNAIEIYTDYERLFVYASGGI